MTRPAHCILGDCSPHPATPGTSPHSMPTFHCPTDRLGCFTLFNTRFKIFHRATVLRQLHLSFPATSSAIAPIALTSTRKGNMSIPFPSPASHVVSRATDTRKAPRSCPDWSYNRKPPLFTRFNVPWVRETPELSAPRAA